MVGRHHLQGAGAQAVPQVVLMELVAERRRHHAARGVLPVLVVVLAFVEHEMLDQRLAVDPLAERSRPRDRLMRGNAGGVDDVERDARLVGEHDGAIGRLALDIRRTRQGVALGPGDSFRHIVPLQRGDEVAVLGVNERHRADFGAADERGEHLLVVDHQRALVGHEMLEGRDARLHHLGHVLAHLVVPVGDAHVVRIVGDGVLRTLVPVGEGLHQRLVAVRDAEVDDHRRAAGDRRLGAALVVVGGIRAHEGHVEMGVGIDAARHDEAVGGVEGAVAPQVFADRLDGFAFDEHIGPVGAVRGNDRSAFDDERHIFFPFGLRGGVSGAAPHCHDTISAFSSTACIRTLAPAVDHSCLMSSVSLWLMPSTQGVKIIEVGAMRAM